jgi:hypothetical protein
MGRFPRITKLSGDPISLTHVGRGLLLFIDGPLLIPFRGRIVCGVPRVRVRVRRPATVTAESVGD